MNFHPQRNRSCNQRSLFINVLYAIGDSYSFLGNETIEEIRIGRNAELQSLYMFPMRRTQREACIYTYACLYVTEIVIRDNGYKLFSILDDRNQRSIIDQTSIYYQYRKIVRKNSKRTDTIFHFHDDRHDCSFIILKM